jgi:uncharacterized membrane protein (UPF0182 family)
VAPFQARDQGTAAALEFPEMRTVLTQRTANNLIGWIAGRSDDENYGSSTSFVFGTS